MHWVAPDLRILAFAASLVFAGDGSSRGGGVSTTVPTDPPAAALDSDGDGLDNRSDAFPNDPAAAVDSDGDGFPDAFNPRATPAQLAATALILDAFPSQAVAALDFDADGAPDGFLPGASPGEIAASGLAQDAAPRVGVADIPTASPFGASPLAVAGQVAGDFEQQLLRFEEFGPEAMPTGPAGTWMALPTPADGAAGESGPASEALESFLAQDGVSPFPTRLSNVQVESPWKAAVEGYLKRPLRLDPALGLGMAGPAEGRPSGEDWAHQSWNEFFPRMYFKTAVAQSRVNLGLRDPKQMHGYRLGEFAPGGLYHRVFTFQEGTPEEIRLDGSTRGIAIRFHPKLPVQAPNSVWTFDGTLPPKLLLVRSGEPILMRNYNALPIDEAKNNGFGRHTITTHEHNGHSPGETDGFPGAFFFPGQFYDYRWPLQLAGFSNNNNTSGAINIEATDPRAALPCVAGERFIVLVDTDHDGQGEPIERVCENTDREGNGTVRIPGDWRETTSSHWFHDHMLDHTSENVYKGNATMMNYYSALDRGNEALDDGINLRFPSGTALSWGNRDYDVNLVIADKAWDTKGQLWMDTRQRNGFLGDRMTVNFLYKPYFDVRARQYRFRLLNGAVARIMALGLVQEVPVAAGKPGAGELPGPQGYPVSYNRVPFYLIANDGNILEHTVAFDGQTDFLGDGRPGDWKGQLPSQSIGERYDIIVDFSRFAPGTRLYFVNILEHADGKGTKGKVPLADILSGQYNPTVNADGRWINGDPGVGKFLELRVKPYAGLDRSMNPADFVAGRRKMIPLSLDRYDPALQHAKRHTFEFVRSEANGGHGTPWAIKVDGGADDRADLTRISAIEEGSTEVWTFLTPGGWTHPVHIHFEEAIILTRGGKAPPEWEKWARKDMFRIGPENDSGLEVEVAFRARDFLGHYVQHCHNTTHEDHAMLLRWDSRKEAAVAIAAPMPTWDGVYFAPSSPLPGATLGDGVGPKRASP